jgi:hypothetical protein
MKKILTLVAVLLVLANTADAQYKQGKDNVVGLNPLGLAFGIYSGEYGRFMDNGATEINIPFFFWKPLDGLTVIGLGAQYRMYADKNASGIFYGGGVHFGSVTWDVTTTTISGFAVSTSTETVTGIVVGPEGVAGYRWLWESGLTLAPTLTLGYSFGKVETSSGTVPSTNPAGFQWGLGLGFGYNF